MPKLSSIYRFIFVLIACILLGIPVQAQEHPDERQNEIRNIERQISKIEIRQDETERQLRKNPGRPDLERELQDLRNNNPIDRGRDPQMRFPPPPVQ